VQCCVVDVETVTDVRCSAARKCVSVSLYYPTELSNKNKGSEDQCVQVLESS